MTYDPAAAVEGTADQQPIPGLAPELPEYHGRKPVGMRTKLTGYGNRTMSPHTIGDRFVLVLEVRCKSATHDDTDDGLVYIESDKVLDMFELHGDPGARLLGTMRSLAKQADDAAAGRVPIAGMKIHTDASGVVLTDAEIAELRNDPVRAVLADQLTPAVIVYQDGTRAMWPDDFKANTPRPSVGTIVEEDNVTFEVVDLLHHATGESLVQASGESEPAGEWDGTAAGDLIAQAEKIRDVILAEWNDMTPEARRAALVQLPADQREAALDALAQIGAAIPPELVDEDGETFALPDAAPIRDTIEGISAEVPDPDEAWTEPDPATAQRIADEDDAQIDNVAFLDRAVSLVLTSIAGLADPDRLAALLEVERGGRGGKKKARAQVERAIGDRIAALMDDE